MSEHRRPSYRALIAIPGFPRLAAASTVARSGTAMLAVVIVLFTLQRFHSASLAGVAVFVSIVPGLAVSPVAGALLDRHRRMLLITADYAIAATSLVFLVALDTTGHLSPGLMLVSVGVASLTNPLSNSGTRSLFPMMVPRELWERVNAVDSSAFVVASIVGPALGGLLSGTAGVRVALLFTAAFYVVALAAIAGMAEPVDARRESTSSLGGDARAALGYVARNRALRGLALTTAMSNVGFGILTVAVPVLVIERLGGSASTVGVMWALTGVGGLVTGILAGRHDSERREVWFILAGIGVLTVSMALLVVSGSIGGGLPLVAAAMVLFGAGNGPFDIGLFSLRQRSTPSEWMGRAFAVSMSLNFVGAPIGSAIAGPVVDRSVVAAFALAAAFQVVAAGCALATLRPPTATGYNRRAPTVVSG